MIGETPARLRVAGIGGRLQVLPRPDARGAAAILVSPHPGDLESICQFALTRRVGAGTRKGFCGRVRGALMLLL